MIPVKIRSSAGYPLNVDQVMGRNIFRCDILSTCTAAQCQSWFQGIESSTACALGRRGVHDNPAGIHDPGKFRDPVLIICINAGRMPYTSKVIQVYAGFYGIPVTVAGIETQNGRQDFAR
jgi:hypothetical protein